MIPAGTNIGFNFAVYDANGVQVQADALPSGVLRVNGTGSTALTIALVEGSNPPEYRATGTVPNDAAAGSVLEGRITATVDGLPQSSAEWRDSVGSLTPTISVVVPPAVANESQQTEQVTAVRGDTLRRTLTLGDIAGRQALWFAVKDDPERDSDDEAVLLVTEADGLVRLNGVAAEDASGASLTVTNETTGATNLVLSADVMAAVTLSAKRRWGVQWKANSGDISEPRAGLFVVTRDVVRATE